MLAKRIPRRIDRPRFPGWASLADVQPGATVTTYDANWSIDPLAAFLGVTRWQFAWWPASNATGLVIAQAGLVDKLVVGGGSSGGSGNGDGGNGGNVHPGLWPFDVGYFPVVIGAGGPSAGSGDNPGNPGQQSSLGPLSAPGGSAARFLTLRPGFGANWVSPITGVLKTFSVPGDPSVPYSGNGGNGGGSGGGAGTAGVAGFVGVRVPID